MGDDICVGRDINGVVATEYNPNQPVLPGVDTNKVADIKGGKEK